ncbi:DUF296 domain-containing protein [Candidatus Sumerlaeota bacterium]|nr:DUF296 domain-containing protein [Candidatus Sumerlaeota bacterium]
MQYEQGSVGRVFVVRLEDGERVYDAIEALAEKENVQSASVFAVGGFRRAGVVCGPVDPDALENIEGQIERFDDAREIVGVGTIFPHEGKAKLHFHAAIGRGDRALVGCPREEATCFLVLEVIVMEILGLSAERVKDASGFALLQVGLGAAR